MVRLLGCTDADDEMLTFYRLPVSLPPLPQPDRDTQRAQAANGIGTVFATIFVLVGLTSGSAMVAPSVPASLLVGAVMFESVAAVVCLAGVLLSDPGIVRRTAETVAPIPEAVATRLAEKAPVPEVNLQEGNRSYCVRLRDTEPTIALPPCFSSRPALCCRCAALSGEGTRRRATRFACGGGGRHNARIIVVCATAASKTLTITAAPLAGASPAVAAEETIASL